jgi:hypothetical protein
VRRPTPALILAVLALVIATLGSGASAVAAGHYLITSSKQIKPGSIKTQNLSKKTVAALSVPGPQGAAGPAGPAGATGAAGPRGPSNAWSLTQTGEAHAVTLPEGSYVVGGTVTRPNSTLFCTLWRSAPQSGASGEVFTAAQSSFVATTVAIGTSFTIGPNDKQRDVYLQCDSGAVPRVWILAVATLTPVP